MDLQARPRWPAGLVAEKDGRPGEKLWGQHRVALVKKGRRARRCPSSVSRDCPRDEKALRGKFMLFAVSVSRSIVHYCPRPSSRGANTFRNDNLLVLLYALSAVHLSVSRKRGWTDSPPATWPRVTTKRLLPLRKYKVPFPDDHRRHLIGHLTRVTSAFLRAKKLKQSDLTGSQGESVTKMNLIKMFYLLFLHFVVAWTYLLRSLLSFWKPCHALFIRKFTLTTRRTYSYFFIAIRYSLRFSLELTNKEN